MKIIGKIINFLLTVWVSIWWTFRTKESIILLFIIIVILWDVFTHNIWHLFPINEIYWYKIKWRICDIAYAIGKSFSWLLAYITIYKVVDFIYITNKSIYIWIATLVTTGMIGAAITDLVEECTGDNFNLGFIEALVFIITFTVIGFKIYKRIKNEQRT